jgi:TPR repeat protein
MHRNGQGVLQDYAEAAMWLGKAAEQEYAPAMYNLGIMYRNGQGVLQDNLFAHMWFNLAASLYPASQKEYRVQAETERDAIASKMTPAQIAEAQKLAREWKPKMVK